MCARVWWKADRDPLVVYKHPLYLREHSKRILRSALFNDSTCSSWALLGALNIISSLPVES